MDPCIPGEIYVPSDDDMSEILHSAGHAYHLYLHSDEDEKDDTSSLDNVAEKSSSVMSWLTSTSSPSTTSTSITPYVSMTFNPVTSTFSSAFKARGPLTSKSHESQGNIPRQPRSRFFHAERLNPWAEDKENDIPSVGGKCLRCFDKAGFTLEPCKHSYLIPEHG
jgi:hypothetical protein